MSCLISNFVKTTVATGFNASTTSIVVSSVAGFPSITSAGVDYFRLTLIRVSDNAKEIVKVTAVNGTTLTVQRGQENTTGLAFVSGDRVELNLTAQSCIDLITDRLSLYAPTPLTEADFGSNKIIPSSAFKDSSLPLRAFTDGLLTGAKIASGALVAPLSKDGSGNIQISLGSTMDVSANQLIVKAASLVEGHSSYGKFVALNGNVATGGTGTGQFYTGSRPWTVYGNAGSGARVVIVTMGNDHATQDATVSIRVGGDLGYYAGTGSDVGIAEVDNVILVNKTVWNAKVYKQSFLIFVPPGNRWMFVDDTPGTGTPNVYTHYYAELH